MPKRKSSGSCWPPSTARALKISVKVVPGASRNGVVGWLGDDWKIRLQAPATDGKANDALCKFLAATLGVPPRSVQIIAGHSSRKKIVEVEGLTPERFAELAGSPPR